MKKNRKLLRILLTCVLLIGLQPMAAFAENEDPPPETLTEAAAGSKTTVTGALNEAGDTWVFTIPENAADTVELDFSGYLDEVIKQGLTVKDGAVTRYWMPGSIKWLGVKVVNSSGKDYGYFDTDFTLDDNKNCDKDSYYIGGPNVAGFGARPSGLECHSITRTLNLPLQSLFNKATSDMIGIENMTKVEETIQAHGNVSVGKDEAKKTEKIPDDVTTYAQYLLWYYNTFFIEGADNDAATLADLPMIYKLNALGYGFDKPVSQGVYIDTRLHDGNHTAKLSPSVKVEGESEDAVTTAGNAKIAEITNLLQNEKIFGTSSSVGTIQAKSGGGYYAWLNYTTSFVETDPDVIKLAKDVIYKYGLRFGFGAYSGDGYDYNKLYFPRPETVDGWNALFADTGELGWSTLVDTQLGVEALKGENLTAAQQSVKKNLANKTYGAGTETSAGLPALSLTGYATVNAHSHMGAFCGLGLTVTLKTAEAAKVSAPGMEKKIVITDEENNVTYVDHGDYKPGETVTFRLKSNVPDYLGDYILPDAPWPPVVTPSPEGFPPEHSLYPELDNRGSYELTFHDKLDLHMTFDPESVAVTLNIEGRDAPITLEKGKTEDDLKAGKYLLIQESLGDGCTFHVKMDLVAVCAKYSVTPEEIESSPGIIVTYNATVNEGTTHGAYPNEAWVTYEDKESEHDKVYVHVYAIDVFKYDQSSRSFVVCLGDTFRSGGTFVHIVVNGEKVITTKDRFAFEGDGSTAQMIESFIANNPDKEGHNEHQWGYKAEAVEGKPNCVKVTALTEDKILPRTTESCYLVGLGGHEYTQNPENHPLPIEFVYPPLAGAEFELYDNEGCTGDAVAKGTSGADGILLFDSLKPGTYYLKETKAPDGYVKSDTVLKVEVKSTESIEVEEHIVHTKFANSNIPHTGGPGTVMYTIGGLLLLLAAGAMYSFSRKRKKNQA